MKKTSTVMLAAACALLGACVAPTSATAPVAKYGWLAVSANDNKAVLVNGNLTVLNTGLVAVAARSATSDGRWRDVLWNRESLLLDTVELCVGVLVTIACAVTPAMLLLALPPVRTVTRRSWRAKTH